MKKSSVFLSVLLLTLAVLIWGCNNNPQPPTQLDAEEPVDPDSEYANYIDTETIGEINNNNNNHLQPLAPLDPEASVEEPVNSDSEQAYELATKAINAINNHDYKTLSEYVHPEKGVIFVPYSYIDYEEQLVFFPNQVSEFTDDNNNYIWGLIDNTDIPIELTVSDYFARYVCDKNFLDTGEVAVNSIIRKGNSIENVVDVFCDSIFIDFHDGGTKEFGGLDWSSLKIVMEKHNNIFKIVAIIHSQYVP